MLPEIFSGANINIDIDINIAINSLCTTIIVLAFKKYFLLITYRFSKSSNW